MSAREELLEALLPTYRAQYAPGEEESANALLDAYAHELAEKIREERHNRYATGLDEEYWPADLIDPEVSP